MTLLFEGRDLRLRFVPGEASDTLVVTFAEREVRRRQGLERPGFGESFLRKAGIPAIHVTAAWNHWYLTPEMAPALEAARAAASGHARIATYGSSMGGYAALLHARALGAQRVVALSPRFAVDPAKVPFHPVEREELPRLDLGADDMEAALAHPARYLVASDIHRFDGGHIARLRAAGRRRLALVPLPFAGHPCGHFLREARLLSGMATRLLLDEEPRLKLWRRRVRAARRLSPRYWSELSHAAAATGRHVLAAEAARRAAALRRDAA
jgi:hypothetical protein